MDFRKKRVLPDHLRDGRGLPRSREERLLVIRRRVEQGYYDTERVKRAVAEAFLDPPHVRRAGEQAFPG
ncbi:MAG: hypothetical protein AB1505_07360 [Candidatus Latescibacterota bacterium]